MEETNNVFAWHLAGKAFRKDFELFKYIMCSRKENSHEFFFPTPLERHCKLMSFTLACVAIRDRFLVSALEKPCNLFCSPSAATFSPARQAQRRAIHQQPREGKQRERASEFH